MLWIENLEIIEFKNIKMNDYNNRLWNKNVKSKHEPFRTRRSPRNVKPIQFLKTRYGVLIKITILDNQIQLYIII